MRLALLLVLSVGCVHRGGMPVPGPLGSLGQEVGRDDAGLARHDPPQKAKPGRRRPSRASPASGTGEAVAEGGASLIGRSKVVINGTTYRSDCSGFVEAAYAKAGLSLGGSSADLFDQARELGVLHHKKTPSPGDVAFFDDTWDRNGNGRRDDPLSHVALVEQVGDDGEIILIHHGGSGITRIRMNLRDPHVGRREDGVVLNDGLRAGRDDGGPRLTAELWRGFASFWAAPPEKPPSDTVADN